jgi:hypothetical protein
VNLVAEFVDANDDPDAVVGLPILRWIDVLQQHHADPQPQRIPLRSGIDNCDWRCSPILDLWD